MVVLLGPPRKSGVRSGHIGYVSYRRHRYHLWSEGICKGFEPAGLIVEVAEIIIHKADEPNTVLGLFDADGLAARILASFSPHAGTDLTVTVDKQGCIVAEFSFRGLFRPNNLCIQSY